MNFLIYLGVIFLHVFLCSGDSGNCSTDHRCVCRTFGNDVKAFCARQNISISPSFSQSVTDIDLSGNVIKETPRRKNLPDKLRKLDLSSNPINSILDESFSNLHYLETLDLGNTTEIDLQNDTIFQDLTSLKYLNIKSLSKSQREDYPIEILLYVSSLETLLMNGHKRVFLEGFRKLVNLRTLDISGTNGHCDLGYIDQDYFQNVGNITNLDISCCHLKNLFQGTFSKLSNLAVLDISYNDELSFSIVQNLTSDLKTTKIEILKLNKIHCTFGRSTMLYRSDVKDLQNTSLKELHIDSNRLQLLEPGVIIGLPKTLEYISIADNKLTLGWFVFEIGFLKNLKKIDMSLQFLSHKPVDIFQLCKDDRNKRPKYISGNLSDTLVEEFMLHSTFYSNMFLRMNISLPRSLEIGFFNSCKLQYEIPSNNFGNNSIKAAYLQNNFLHKWTGPVSGMHTLQILDLSNNVCTDMTTNFFDDFIGLRVLNISDNFVGYSIQKDKKGLSFQYLKQLIQLDMSSNKIQTLPPVIFKNLFSLRKLILKDNLLTEIGADISHMRKLHHFDVSDNLLTEIDEKTRNDIDLLISTSDNTQNLSIQISGNPLHCNCENLQFIKWLVTTKAKVVHDKNQTCQTKFDRNNLIYLNDLSNFQLTLERNCKSYTVLTVITVSLTMVIITVIVCGIVYRYRWKLRFLYYMTKGRYKGRIILQQDDQYEYDAFISYADEDRTFGFHQMRQKVAEEGNIRLCFHSKDFIPGVDIAENITTAIHSSRRTICVISQNYMNSYWCRYELNMARMESIYSRNGQNVLFLVLYKRLENYPAILQDLIENKTYVEYPNDEQGDIVFWDTLRKSINQIT